MLMAGVNGFTDTDTESTTQQDKEQLSTAEAGKHGTYKAHTHTGLLGSTCLCQEATLCLCQ